jgi:hypothetical protein
VSYRGGSQGNWDVTRVVYDDDDGIHNDFAKRFNKLDGNAGVQFTFTGVDNLKAGAQFSLGDYTVANGQQGLFVNNFFLRSSFGAQYKTDDFGFGLNFGLTPSPGVSAVEPDAVIDLHISGFYKIMDGLKVELDFLGVDLGDVIQTNVGVGLNVAYDADPLAASLTVRMVTDASGSNFWNAAGSGDELAVWLQVKADYKIMEGLSAGLTWKMDPLFHDPIDTNAEAQIRVNYAAGDFAAGAEFTLKNILANEGKSMSLKIAPSLSY